MEHFQQLALLWPFSEMDTSSCCEVARCARRRHFRSGDTIFHEGDPAHSLYLIVSGAVNLEQTLPNGAIRHLVRFAPLDLVDENSLPNGKPRAADAVTVGPCELLIVEGTPFMKCLERSARFSARFMEGIFERQHRRFQAQARFQTLTVAGRVAATLLELSEIYGTAEAAGVKRLEISITQQEMARWVGVQRESVNRTFASLKRLGAIRQDRRQLVILNETRLRTYSGSDSTGQASPDSLIR